MEDENSIQASSFEAYLITVAIRSQEYTYSDDEIINSIDYFKKSYNNNISPYKALLFLNDYINGEYII